MPLRTTIKTDGVISSPVTRISAPLDIDAVRAFARAHNRRCTFDGAVADLESACQRDLPAPGSSPAVGSRPWFAQQIVIAIDAARRALQNGQADLAASEAVTVGVLAAQADARHKWPSVRRGLKSLASTQAAGRARGKDVTDEAQQLDLQIERMIARFNGSVERLTIRKIAENLEKHPVTIQRHLKKMGRSLPAK